MYCHFAKWRHTIMPPRHCGAQLYAGYASVNHSRHIHRLLAVLWAGLCAAIFKKCECRQLENRSATACIPYWSTAIEGQRTKGTASAKPVKTGCAKRMPLSARERGLGRGATHKGDGVSRPLCASGGNRTRTDISVQGILSPSCLPFHHQGSRLQIY